MNKKPEKINMGFVKVPTQASVAKAQVWMDPLNRIIWQKAFKKKLKEVQLRDGRLFSIDYKKRPGTAFVEPIGKELAPRGYIDLKTALSPEWLEG